MSILVGNYLSRRTVPMWFPSQVPSLLTKFSGNWQVFQEVLFLNMGVAVLEASASLMVYTIAGSCCVTGFHTEGGRWLGGGAFLLPHSDSGP